MKRPPGKDMLGRSRELHRRSTDAERLLRQHLLARQLEGHKFRRQMWLRGFIADFACPEAKLVIEADGGQHNELEAADRRRSAAFAEEGYRTLRFWNNEILENLDGVLTTIKAALLAPSHAAMPGGPIPLLRRERNL